MDLVKRIPGMVIVLLALSETAFCQSSTTSYSFNIQMAPDCKGYNGQLFCTVAYGKSLDTLFMNDEPLVFRDSLPVLHVSVYVKPLDSSSFYLLAVFDRLFKDTSYLIPLKPLTQVNTLFFGSREDVILLAPPRGNHIAALETRPRLQLHFAKRERRPQRRKMGCGITPYPEPIPIIPFSILDLRTQGQWLLPRE